MFNSKSFLLFTFLLTAALLTACSNTPQAAQKKIDKIAQNMQAQLPKMLDRDTKLVTVYTRKLELVSEYELVNYKPTETDNQKVKNNIELYLKKKVCPDIKKDLLSKGVSSRYIYKGRDSQIIGDWLISPGDC